MTPSLCRDCDARADGAEACPACGSRRLVAHPELLTLALAHLDCDAFYASVEKRDRPELRDRPVIVGGGQRGVVSACCYIARRFGVRSAMPMFKALAACPDAVVIRPDMAKYVETARQVRSLMAPLTPLVQPLSIDEAVLDLSGTQALHGASAALMLMRLSRAIEAQVGVTVSIGLAPNRMLAKMASEMDKPRGFAVIGAAQARQVLADRPVEALPGVGPKLAARLARLGFTRIGQLAALDAIEASRAVGEDGPRLATMARGEDARLVTTDEAARSVSAETTFESDLASVPELEARLWPLCERLSTRLKAKGVAAAGVVLKLKTAAFATRSRQVRLAVPTQLAETLFAAARPLLAREATGTRFRLIGIGAAGLAPAEAADRGDLADPDAKRRVARDRALDAIRGRFGQAAIRRGRGL